MTESYRGWDVHAHTMDMRAALRDWGRTFPGGRKIMDETLPAEYIEKSVIDFIVERDATLKPVLQKMVGRTQKVNGRVYYPDPDLGNINIWSVLSLCVVLVKELPDLEALMLEMLRDAAQTCIQGDSHRLLMFLLVGSRKEE